MKIFKILVLLIFFCVNGSHAFYYGPFTIDQNGLNSSANLAYGTGSRDITKTSGSEPDLEMDVNGVYFNFQYAPIKSLHFFGRLIPGTGKTSFENFAFDPKVFGAGFGIKYIFPQKSNPISVGILGSWDAYGGADETSSGKSKRFLDLFFDRGNNYVTWNEATMAIGASIYLSPEVIFSSGISYIRSRIDFHFENLPNQVFELDSDIGGFIGIEFHPGKRFLFAAEYHAGNENVIDFHTGFKFGLKG